MSPIGYLWLQKAVTGVFGSGETAFRLVPFAASLAALFVFAWLASRLLRPTGAIVAVGLFAVNHRLIYYSSEFKQYGIDVAVTVAILAIGLAVMKNGFTTRRLVCLALAGTLGGWMSHPACFVLAAFGCAMAFVSLRRHDQRGFRLTVALGVWWLITVVPALVIERGNLAADDLMVFNNYWVDGFPPFSKGPIAVLAWIGLAFRRVTNYLFEPFALGWRPGLVLWWTLMFALVAGAVLLAKRRFGVFLLLVTPWLFVLVGAFAHKLPFFRRLMLFLIPVALLILGEALDALAERIPPWGPMAAWAFGTALFGSTLFGTLAVLPQYHAELRQVLVAMRARARAGDTVYLNNGAIRAFQYYEPRLALPPWKVVRGCCSVDQWQLDLEALRKLGGRQRVWLVMTEWRGPEPSFLLMALDYWGRRSVSIRAPGAAAYLYELPEVSSQAFDDVLALVPPSRSLAERDWACSAGIQHVPGCGVP